MSRALLPMALLALSACGLVVGPLQECRVDEECADPALRCLDGLCVAPLRPALDARCRRLGGGSDAGVVTLGSLLPLTRVDGGVNPTGVARENSLVLAMEQLNPGQRMGLKGKALELLACDTGSSPAQADALARHLVAQGVAATFSAGSAETIAIAQVTVPAGVLLMSVSASAPEIGSLPDTPPGASAGTPGLVWRTAPPDTLQGRVVAAELRDAGTPKVAVLQLNDAYGQGLGGAFVEAYPQGRSSPQLFRTRSELDQALGRAAAFAPGALFVIAFPDDAAYAVSRAQTMPELAGKPLFFSDAAKSPALLTATVPASALEGALGTGVGPIDARGEAAQWFVPQYTQRFGLDPTSVNATGNAFDAMMCVALAAYRAGRDVRGATLAAGLTRLSRGKAVPLIPTRFAEAAAELDRADEVDVVGVSGPLQFDAAVGEAPGPIEVWRVVSGAFTTARVVAP